MSGTRGLRSLLRVNQKLGFDCPGCAWPEGETRSIAEFCENGAKAVADAASNRLVGADFIGNTRLQGMDRQKSSWFSQQGRIEFPLVFRVGNEQYKAIDWDNALDEVAEKLLSLDHPNEAVFYTSGRTSNEAAFVYQLFVRMFGTNNLPDCSNLCHESSGVGLTESIGIGKGTVRLSDFEHADCIIILGQNPGTNHPRMLTTLQAAARRGCDIISVNPLKEAGLVAFKNPQEMGGYFGSATPISSRYLQVKINGDLALLKGIGKHLLRLELEHPGKILDHLFINDMTKGYDAYREDLERTTWPEIEASCGLSRVDIEDVGDIIGRSKNIIACWAMGITQHKNGVANVQQIANLLLSKGAIGRHGAGLCPVRGHSNVQGDRTMGITNRPSPAFLDRLGQVVGFNPPREMGLDAASAIESLAHMKSKVFVGLGGNFYSASPDTAKAKEAIYWSQMSVHISTHWNQGHVFPGDLSLVLPTLTRPEKDMQRGVRQFVTVENSMGIVSKSQGELAPISRHLKSEVWIICQLAKRVLGLDVVDWEKLSGDYGAIRALIEQVIPGFDHFNERIEEAPYFELPNGPREREFTTPTGKAQFIPHPISPINLAPGQLLMMTIRSHDQFNTTVYSDHDRYRNIKNNRMVIFVNLADIEAMGFRPDDIVDIQSHYGDEKRWARRYRIVPYDIPRGCSATYFPETNVLVPLGHKADRSHTPASKSVVISLHRPGQLEQDLTVTTTLPG